MQMCELFRSTHFILVVCRKSYWYFPFLWGKKKKVLSFSTQCEFLRITLFPTFVFFATQFYRFWIHWQRSELLCDARGLFVLIFLGHIKRFVVITVTRMRKYWTAACESLWHHWWAHREYVLLFVYASLLWTTEGEEMTRVSIILLYIFDAIVWVCIWLCKRVLIWIHDYQFPIQHQLNSCVCAS